MRHSAVTLKEVAKAYGGAWLRRANGNGRKLAVDRVSFDVKPGEIFGVLGQWIGQVDVDSADRHAAAVRWRSGDHLRS